MNPALFNLPGGDPEHLPVAAAFDGGDLDCGNGLLLLIRKHIDPLAAGKILKLSSREISVREDLPAWCRMTGNDLLAQRVGGVEGDCYWVCKGLWQSSASVELAASVEPAASLVVDPEWNHPAERLLATAATPRVPTSRQPVALPALAVMGIGSWPRPAWLIAAGQARLSGKLSEAAFQELANDAVRLAIQSQEAAAVDVITDGEQRRDNYASFVGLHLENCQLVPLVDLLPYVDDPETFRQSLESLDVPADQIRHPAVFGPLRRRGTLTVGELEYAREWTPRPIKVSLPGPYLLTRIMWMECLSDRHYQEREALAADIVKILRAELQDLLAAGVDLVQFDEPVLTEVVMGRAAGQRSFMCGALGQRLPIAEELALVEHWYRELMHGIPEASVGIHVCRGNWSRDESLALQGSYQPLMELFARLPIGNYWLEMCTPRAGDWRCLVDLPPGRRLGVGMVNQKLDSVESVDEIAKRVEQACDLFGPERLMLTPDCGFATFADKPLAAEPIARSKLAALVAARNRVLGQR